MSSDTPPSQPIYCKVEKKNRVEGRENGDGDRTASTVSHTVTKAPIKLDGTRLQLLVAVTGLFDLSSDDNVLMSS